jgi:hypothetical protein
LQATLKVPRPSPTQKPRRPSLSFRPPASSGGRAACRRRIPARGACAGRTTAGWAS